MDYLFSNISEILFNFTNQQVVLVYSPNTQSLRLTGYKIILVCCPWFLQKMNEKKNNEKWLVILKILHMPYLKKKESYVHEEIIIIAIKHFLMMFRYIWNWSIFKIKQKKISYFFRIEKMHFHFHLTLLNNHKRKYELNLFWNFSMHGYTLILDYTHPIFQML